MLLCDFCGVEKEAYEIAGDQLVTNFARISSPGPHHEKHICEACYTSLLPIGIYSACSIRLADGEHEGFVMNHSFMSEEPSYIVVVRGLEYDGEEQEYVLLSDIPVAIVLPREGETIPEELKKEWESARAEAGAH